MDIVKLVDNILADRITIKDLDMQQMEAVIDFMREHIDAADDESGEVLLAMIDAIETAAEARFGNQAAGEWDETIEASITRGNCYFELEDYVLQ